MKLLALVIAIVAVAIVTPVSAQAADTPTGGSDTLSTTTPPTEPPLPDPPHTPITYTVGQYMDKVIDTLPDGSYKVRTVLVTEDVNYIANKLSLTTDEIKYSNPDTDISNLKSGDRLSLPPVHGIVYKILAGDTLSWLAYSYQVTVDAIVQYNNITDADVITPDQVIIIPGAKLPPLPPVTPVYTPVSSSGSDPATSSPQVSAPGNHFSFGFCTWHVDNLWHSARGQWIPWFGDAGQWGPNARAMGYAEGMTPRVGAIMVSWEGPVGHVAYVIAVSGNTFTVSEMNFNAWDVVDTRTITIGTIPLETFIY